MSSRREGNGGVMGKNGPSAESKGRGESPARRPRVWDEGKSGLPEHEELLDMLLNGGYHPDVERNRLPVWGDKPRGEGKPGGGGIEDGGWKPSGFRELAEAMKRGWTPPAREGRDAPRGHVRSEGWRPGSFRELTEALKAGWESPDMKKREAAAKTGAKSAAPAPEANPPNPFGMKLSFGANAKPSDEVKTDTQPGFESQTVKIPAPTPKPAMKPKGQPVNKEARREVKTDKQPETKSGTVSTPIPKYAERGLFPEEKAVLREVYPDLDLNKVRVKPKGAGSFLGRTRTIGPVIHVNENDMDDNGRIKDIDTLIHEGYHARSYQQRGWSYATDALSAFLRHGEDCYNTPGNEEYNAEQFTKQVLSRKNAPVYNKGAK